MAKKWKDILTDTATYGDDFVISLKNGETMSLGDMRAYDKEHEGELTQRLTAKEQEISTREKNLSTAEIHLGTVIEKTAERAGLSVEDFLQGKAPTRKQVAESADLDENDPLVGKLVKEIKTLRSELATTREEIGSVKKSALGPMLNTYLEDYYESRWDKISPTLPKNAKVELKDALDYANKNGLKDQKGRFDLAKAVRDLTFDARVEELADKKASELAKKNSDREVLANVPKPSGTHINVKPDKAVLNEKGRVKDFDEVLADAAADTDMWRSITQVQ